MRNHTIFVTVLVLLVFILNSCTTISNKHKIVGKWNADEMLSYVFDKKGYAKIYMGEQVIGGSDLFSGSALKYKIDYSNDPITLDLIHVDKADDKERNRMAMIIKFLSNNKIQIKTFNSSKRPEKFEENDENVFTLNRESATGKKSRGKIKEKE